MIEQPERDAAARTGGSRIRITGKGETFEFPCAPGERILHAGLRSGIDLPYECATGTCGTCKATVLEGETAYVWPDAPGRKYTKSEKNEMLMCQSVALTDCTLQVAKRLQRTAPERFAPVLVEGVLDGVHALTADVVALDVTLEKPVCFEAGQFALLQVPGVVGARSYSMVNFARDTTKLEFVIKRFPGGGFSEWLFGSTPGSTPVKVFGPLGHATFDPGIARHILCIAGGSGIAGMMSILAHAVDEHYFAQYDGNVFFGVRTEADAFYLDELAAFVRRAAGRLTVTIALSHGEAGDALRAAYPELRFDRGFVHEVAARTMAGRYADTMAYVAGPPPMVDAALRVLLLEARLSAANIRYDKFS